MSHPFRHFYTITKHRHCVIAHCFRVGIGWQGLFHDLSKYSLTEFIPGANNGESNDPEKGSGFEDVIPDTDENDPNPDPLPDIDTGENELPVQPL